MTKQKSKDGRRSNPLKHGAFAQELLIFDEDECEFEAMRRGFVEEFKPSRGMEEDLVFEISKLHWQKLRIERFYLREAGWIQADASGEEDLECVALIDRMVVKGLPCRDVWEMLMTFLPEQFRDEVKREFQYYPSQKYYDDEWVEKLKKFIHGRLSIADSAIQDKRHSARFLGETSAKQMDLSLKRIAIEERLNAMIDKAFKRLVQIKTYKEVLATQNGGAGRRLSGP